MTLVAFDESALPDADTLVALYDLDNGKRKHAELKYTCEQVYAKYWRPSVSVDKNDEWYVFRACNESPCIQKLDEVLYRRPDDPTV